MAINGNRFFYLLALSLLMLQPACGGKEKSLATALSSSDRKVREDAVRELGKLENSYCVDLLITALDDEECRIRALAAEFLGNKHDKRAETPLLALLKKEHDIRTDETLPALMRKGLVFCDVLPASIHSLGQIGSPAAVKPLANMLYDETDALSGDERYVAAMDADLNRQKKREDRRFEVVEALVKIGPPSTESLIEALTSGGISTQELAASALGRIGDSRAIGPLISVLGKDWILNAEVRKALAAMGPDAVEPLAAALENGDANVRINVAEILVNFSNAKAAASLRAALDRETDKKVKEKIMRLLSQGY